MSGGVKLTAVEKALVERTARDNPEHMVPVVEAILLNRRFHRLHPVVADRRMQRGISPGPSPSGPAGSGAPGRPDVDGG